MKNAKCRIGSGDCSFLHFAFYIYGFRRLLRHMLAVEILFVGLLTIYTQAEAHSILVESVPAQGAKLVTSPPTAQLRFNSKIEPALTRVSLVEGRQRRTALEVSKESVIDKIIVPLPPLGPGVYSIAYKVLALDGHVTSGMIQFTVLPAAAVP